MKTAPHENGEALGFVSIGAGFATGFSAAGLAFAFAERFNSRPIVNAPIKKLTTEVTSNTTDTGIWVS
jgi:hypothetical protein